MIFLFDQKNLTLSFTPRSDQQGISPYNIHKYSNRKATRGKKSSISRYCLISHKLSELELQGAYGEWHRELFILRSWE